MKKMVAFMSLQFGAAVFMIMAVAMPLYGTQLQIEVWASICDIWKPSVWPLLISIHYWVLPIVWSTAYLLDAICRAIEGMKHRTWWLLSCAIMWIPLVFIPASTFMLALCMVASWVGSIKVINN